MSAPEEIAGVVETAADEFKKIMDTLAELFEHLQATEKAAKAGNVQEELLKAIKELKEQVAGLKEKPGELTPGKMEEVQQKWQKMQPSLKGVPKLFLDKGKVGDDIGFSKDDKGNWMRPDGSPVRAIGGHRNAVPAPKLNLGAGGLR